MGARSASRALHIRLETRISERQARLRLVFDTNIWLDWLVFADPSIGPLRGAVAAKTARIFIDAACLAELERVLAYPLGRHSIDAAAQAACLLEVHRVSEVMDKSLCAEDRRALPACRDRDDQKFLEAALAARADFLVTKDQALLELARGRKRPLPFRIVTPRFFPAPT